MANAPFPIQPELTAVAVAYKNARLIADEVLPRVPVSKQEFKYLKHSLAEGFTLPDTKVGRKSKPTEVDFTASEVTVSTEDYGLEDPLPQADIDNAPPNYNPLLKATETLADLLALDRERRVSALVFNAATYAAANKITLAGQSQWSDVTNSDPIKTIMDALDACVMRPTIMVIGRPAYSVLVRHPKIVKAVLGNAGDAGIARRQDLADLFELAAVLVGEGWLNSAKKGQAVSLARVWGKHCAFLYRDQLADVSRGTSFGLTAQFGGRIAGSRLDPDIGLKGGARVRVGESVKELITANDLGYFVQNAVA